MPASTNTKVVKARRASAATGSKRKAEAITSRANTSGSSGGNSSSNSSSSTTSTTSTSTSTRAKAVAVVAAPSSSTAPVKATRKGSVKRTKTSAVAPSADTAAHAQVAGAVAASISSNINAAVASSPAKAVVAVPAESSSGSKSQAANVVKRHSHPASPAAGAASRKKSERTVHKCDACDYKTNRKDNLRKHLLVHTDARPEKCDICGAGFKDKSNRNAHKRSVHSSARPFQCGNCDAAFKSKKTLVQHSHVHANRANYHCTTCSVSYKTTKSLAAHLDRLHNASQEAIDLRKDLHQAEQRIHGLEKLLTDLDPNWRRTAPAFLVSAPSTISRPSLTPQNEGSSVDGRSGKAANGATASNAGQAQSRAPKST
eukprot:INCI16375.1.p2 GENE.INCI16375.1~~INCI16375.1.p2  ORF type:complete len:372 (+),score=62.54 INCI16375.1:193-1308(+)